MNLECGRDRLDLNARLLTQPNRGELKLVAVPINLPWTGSWHDTFLVRRKCLRNWCKSLCQLQQSLDSRRVALSLARSTYSTISSISIGRNVSAAASSAGPNHK